MHAPSFRPLIVTAGIVGALAVLAPHASVSAPAPLPTPPPAAARGTVSETFFGTTVADPYRWLEDLQSAPAQAFFRDQNAYARAILDGLGEPRRRLLARIRELDNASAVVSGVNRVGDRYFYERLAPGEQHPKLYVRDAAPGSPAHVLLDPDAQPGAAQQNLAIAYAVPSLDGRYVAVGLAGGGSENATIRVIETATARMLPDAITRGRFGVSGWRSDGTSFYYLRQPAAAPGQPLSEENVVTYLHVLGGDPDRDAPVLGPRINPAVAVAPSDDAFVITTPASRYAIAQIVHGVQNEITLYAAPAASVTGASTPWRKLVDVDAGVTGYDLEGDTIYLLTHAGAPGYKVVAMPIARPDFTAARTVVAPSRDVVEQVAVAANGLFVRARSGGFGRLERFPLAPGGAVTGAATAVALPYQGAIGSLTTDPRVPGATFGLTGWTRSLLYYGVDAAGRVADTRLKPLSPVDGSAYGSHEVEAPSADGTLVPLSIVAKNALPLDGSHPAFLEGYGAYGVTLEPAFSTIRIAWMERGGVFAVCHMRGGGWYGEDWHRAGMLATKQHTIDDFIACGRWLVAHGYTSPAHLGGEGGSAGGIPIGGAVTQAPDLFAALVDDVGVTNALRSEFSPNGPPNIPEFGSVTTEAGFRALSAMDAQSHLRPGTAYPAVLAATGINDPRVPSWEAAKFVAGLQADSTSGRPALLRVDYAAGHGFGSARAQSEELLGDEFSFLLWQLGDPGFQTLPQRIGRP